MQQYIFISKEVKIVKWLNACTCGKSVVVFHVRDIVCKTLKQQIQKNLCLVVNKKPLERVSVNILEISGEGEKSIPPLPYGKKPCTIFLARTSAWYDPAGTHKHMLRSMG